MANKRFSAVKLLFLLFCLFVGAGRGVLYAQDFSQTLKWGGDPNVLEYKVEIQDSTGKIIESITTEESSVKLSLTQGRYKYKITAYDLLGRESVSTNWISFEVAIAKQPEIAHKKEMEALNADGKTLELIVDIEDVTTETIAELVNVQTNARIAGKLVIAAAAGAPAAGLSASETFKAEKVRFTDVPEGKWKLVITNPSGLSSESDTFEVKDVEKEKRIAAQKAEEERLAREKAEREEAERIAAERRAAEEAERKRLAEIEAQRLAAEEAKRAAEEAERQRQEQLVAEQAERERLAREAEEAARLEEERLAREAEEAARLEEERLAREAEEAERLAAEKEEAKRKRREAWLTYDRKFNITAGAGASINLLENDFFDIYMEDNAFKPTLNAKIGVLPVHTKSGRFRFGMEFNGMATRFQSQNEYYNLNFDMLVMQPDLSLRFGLKSKKVWFQLNGGGGIVIMKEILDYTENTENNKEDKTFYYGYFTAGGGLSVIFTPTSTFRIEIGADYYNLFIPEMNLGLLNPYIGIGLRF